MPNGGSYRIDALWVYLLLIALPYAHCQSSVTLDSCAGTGMKFTVVVDETIHGDGDQWYLADCPSSMPVGLTITESGAYPILTYAVEVSVDAMKQELCGGYDTTTNPDNPRYQILVIIPYLSFLVTALDVKVELECVLTTTFKATVVPTVGVSTQGKVLPKFKTPVGAWKRVASSDTHRATTKDPEVAAWILDYAEDIVPVQVAVGEHVRMKVNITNSRANYWTAIVIDVMRAYESSVIGEGATNVALVQDSCPSPIFASYLDIVYQQSTKAPQTEVTFKAFRFKAAESIKVYFVFDVTVCATTSPTTACTIAIGSCARRKRGISDFMDKVLQQSHKDKRDLDLERNLATKDFSKSMAPMHKTIKLSMIVRDPAMDRYKLLRAKSGVAKMKNQVCMQLGTSVVVFVSLVILGLSVVTFTVCCFCLGRQRRMKKREAHSVMSSDKGLPEKHTEASTTQNYQEDVLPHNNNLRSHLIGNDYLQAVTTMSSKVVVVEQGPSSHLLDINEGETKLQIGKCVGRLATIPEVEQKQAGVD